MNYSIGDKVVYIGKPKEKFWKLEKYKTYEIINCAFSMRGDENYYAVNIGKGGSICWFDEKDFISIIKARKLKIKKLNEIL